MPPPFFGISAVLNASSKVIFGKEREIKLALSCLLAKGHLLIEDLPGVGKTTLAHTLAALLGLQFQRVQFTSDLLPADILGVSIFEKEQSTFRFIPGPVFTQLLLADEINRATPKTQSALLEAMEEKQVTTEGETRRLPEPFFVIATQNPTHQIGTFSLPESQLDRFLMRIALGYPDRAAERQLLANGDARNQIKDLQTQLSAEDLLHLQKRVSVIRCSDALLDYLQMLLAATRLSTDFVHGLSPRAGLATLAAARAWALIDGRDYVVPEDVQMVFPYVARHRLLTPTGFSASEEQLNQLLRSTPIP